MKKKKNYGQVFLLQSLIFPGVLHVLFTPTSKGWNLLQDLTIGKRKKKWDDSQNQVSAFNKIEQIKVI